MLNIIIIENDIEAIKFLKETINEIDLPISIEGYATTIKDAINLISSTSPNLIFLDIELDDGLGFEILDFFKNPKFDIFFITGFDNYYKEAFEHYAFTYVLKPLEKKTLELHLRNYTKKKGVEVQKIQALRAFVNSQNPHLLIHSGNTHHSIHLENIIYFQAEGNYSKVFLNSGRNIITNQGLIYFNELLKHRGFFRANRSYLLNTFHIKSIYKRQYIILSNGQKVSVSTRNKEKLMDFINFFK